MLKVVLILLLFIAPAALSAPTSALGYAFWTTICVLVLLGIFRYVQCAPERKRQRAEMEAQRQLEIQRESIYQQYLTDPRLLSDAEFSASFQKYIDWHWVKRRFRGSHFRGAHCAHCRKWFRRGEIHIDHIKPRSKHPQLAFALSNLQFLCAQCNSTKSAYDGDDWKREITRRKRAKTTGQRRKLNS